MYLSSNLVTLKKDTVIEGNLNVTSLNNHECSTEIPYIKREYVQVTNGNTFTHTRDSDTANRHIMACWANYQEGPSSLNWSRIPDTHIKTSFVHATSVSWEISLNELYSSGSIGIYMYVMMTQSIPNSQVAN